MRTRPTTRRTRATAKPAPARRARAKKPEPVAAAGPSHIATVEDPVLVKGDAVKVTGHPGDWTFHERKRNTDTGDEWVTVYGGSTNPSGVRNFRSFAPDKVRKIRRRERPCKHS